MCSIKNLSCRSGLIFAGVIFVLLALSFMPVQTSSAQDDDVHTDSECRTQSSLSLIPGVLSNGGYAPNFDPSYNVVLILNTNHFLDQVSPYVCNKDKFKPLADSFVNVCYYEQYSVGFFTVVPCDCRFSSLFYVRVRFSENYNINGGIINPRYKDVAMTLDPDPSWAQFCGF